MLAFGPNANALALTFTDIHVVGTVTPVDPADPASEASYINFMITLSPGGSGTFHNPGHKNETITRSNNSFTSLPNALVMGAVPGTGTIINLGAGGVFSYLFAKYDGQNDTSVVWYVGNLNGIITIPQNGPLGYGLSGWTLFPPGAHVGGHGVPDGGATVMLLGGALGVLGLVRRFLKS